MPLGELYLLKISPWSRKIRDVLRHTKAAVTLRWYQAFFTGFMLKLRGRIGRDVPKVTAPIYFSKDGSKAAVMDGFLIAKILDDARQPPTAPTLFPDEHMQQIEALVAAAEVCVNFWRGHIFDVMIKRPETTPDAIVPPPLKWLPFRNFAMRFIMKSLREKYMPETLEARKNGTIENALDTITEALKAGNGTFLVGDTRTYADIAVAYSLPFVHPTSSPWKSLGNHSIGEKYTELKRWGEAYFGP